VLKSLLRRMRNRVSATPASLDRVQVAVTAPRCSGSVSWAALPDVACKGITFTMPDVLWPIFHDNPHLAAALSASAAKIPQCESLTSTAREDALDAARGED